MVDVDVELGESGEVVEAKKDEWIGNRPMQKVIDGRC